MFSFSDCIQNVDLDLTKNTTMGKKHLNLGYVFWYFKSCWKREKFDKKKKGNSSRTGIPSGLLVAESTENSCGDDLEVTDSTHRADQSQPTFLMVAAKLRGLQLLSQLVYLKTSSWVASALTWTWSDRAHTALAKFAMATGKSFSPNH